MINKKISEIWNTPTRAYLEATKPKCTKCYDKGFATVYQGGVYAMADFCGDKTVCLKNQGVEVKYCTCAKGKRLKHQATKPVSASMKK